MKVIVTGAIGCGKSTVVRRAMNALQWRKPAGFFTTRTPDALNIEAWRGGNIPFARHAERPRDGMPSYEADLDAFSRFAIQTLAPLPPKVPVVLDELGVLELPSSQLAVAIATLFFQPNPVLAVIQQRSIKSWIPVIGRGNVDHILSVDAANRDALPGRIAALFGNA